MSKEINYRELVDGLLHNLMSPITEEELNHLGYESIQVIAEKTMAPMMSIKKIGSDERLSFKGEELYDELARIETELKEFRNEG